MLAALGRGDQPAYFQLLLGSELHVAVRTPGWRQHAVTWSSGGLTYLPVFTSATALAVWAGRDAVTETLGYPELADGWPDRHWRLAVDPHLPIGMFLLIGDVPLGAAGVLRVPTMDDLTEPDDALGALLARASTEPASAEPAATEPAATRPATDDRATGGPSGAQGDQPRSR